MKQIFKTPRDGEKFLLIALALLCATFNTRSQCTPPVVGDVIWNYPSQFSQGDVVPFLGTVTSTAAWNSWTVEHFGFDSKFTQQYFNDRMDVGSPSSFGNHAFDNLKMLHPRLASPHKYPWQLPDDDYIYNNKGNKADRTPVWDTYSHNKQLLNQATQRNGRHIIVSDRVDAANGTYYDEDNRRYNVVPSEQFAVTNLSNFQLTHPDVYRNLYFYGYDKTSSTFDYWFCDALLRCQEIQFELRPNEMDYSLPRSWQAGVFFNGSLSSASAKYTGYAVVLTKEANSPSASLNLVWLEGWGGNNGPGDSDFEVNDGFRKKMTVVNTIATGITGLNNETFRFNVVRNTATGQYKLYMAHPITGKPYLIISMANPVNLSPNNNIKPNTVSGFGTFVGYYSGPNTLPVPSVMKFERIRFLPEVSEDFKPTPTYATVYFVDVDTKELINPGDIAAHQHKPILASINAMLLPPTGAFCCGEFADYWGISGDFFKVTPHLTITDCEGDVWKYVGSSLNSLTYPDPDIPLDMIQYGRDPESNVIYLYYKIDMSLSKNARVNQDGIDNGSLRNPVEVNEGDTLKYTLNLYNPSTVPQVAPPDPSAGNSGGDNNICNLAFTKIWSRTGASGTAHFHVPENSYIAKAADGKVYGWGSNNTLVGVYTNYLATSNSANNVLIPTEIPSLSGENIIDVCFGSANSFALTADGKLFVRGGSGAGTGAPANEFTDITGISGNPLYNKKIEKIWVSMNTDSTLPDCIIAKTKDGDFYCWGMSNRGQFGNGGTGNSTTPLLNSNLKTLGIVDIYPAGSAFIGRTAAGKLYAWGPNGSGQLGTSTIATGVSEFTATPIELTAEAGNALQGKNIKRVWTSAYFTGYFNDNLTTVFAQDNADNIYSWGYNNNGLLGLADNADRKTPVQVSAFNGKGVTEIWLGVTQGMAKCADGYYSWGNANFGGLGREIAMGTDAYYAPAIMNTLNALNPTMIYMGGHHVMVSAANGKFYGWGYNAQGQLGMYDLTHRNTPTEIHTLNGKDIAKIHVFGSSSIARAYNGKVWVWGYNNNGQLGTGDIVNKYPATQTSNYCFSFFSLLKPEMIPVTGGSFMYGAQTQNSTNPVFASPVGAGTATTIGGFSMSATPVTQAQYKAVMGINPSFYSPSGGGASSVATRPTANLPVEMVSWYDAITYCNKLSIMEGKTPVYSVKVGGVEVDWKNLAHSAVPSAYNAEWSKATQNLKANGYRLPTGTEWEYAARGGQKSNYNTSGGADYFYSGSNDVNVVAWYNGNNGTIGATTPPYFGTKAVGEKAPNALGLYDMNGNVDEWCWNFYDGGSDEREARGGSFGSGAAFSMQVTSRTGIEPSDVGQTLGFRVVCNPVSDSFNPDYYFTITDLLPKGLTLQMDGKEPWYSITTDCRTGYSPCDDLGTVHVVKTMEDDRERITFYFTKLPAKSMIHFNYNAEVIKVGSFFNGHNPEEVKYRNPVTEEETETGNGTYHAAGKKIVEKYWLAPCDKNPDGIFSGTPIWQDDKTLVNETTDWKYAGREKQRDILGYAYVGYQLFEDGVAISPFFKAGNAPNGVNSSPQWSWTALDQTSVANHTIVYYYRKTPIVKINAISVLDGKLLMSSIDRTASGVTGWTLPTQYQYYIENELRITNLPGYNGDWSYDNEYWRKNLDLTKMEGFPPTPVFTANEVFAGVCGDTLVLNLYFTNIILRVEYKEFRTTLAGRQNTTNLFYKPTTPCAGDRNWYHTKKYTGGAFDTKQWCEANGAILGAEHYEVTGITGSPQYKIYIGWSDDNGIHVYAEPGMPNEFGLDVKERPVWDDIDETKTLILYFVRDDKYEVYERYHINVNDNTTYQWKECGTSNYNPGDGVNYLPSSQTPLAGAEWSELLRASVYYNFYGLKSIAGYRYVGYKYNTDLGTLYQGIPGPSFTSVNEGCYSIIYCYEKLTPNDPILTKTGVSKENNSPAYPIIPGTNGGSNSNPKDTTTNPNGSPEVKVGNILEYTITVDLKEAYPDTAYYHNPTSVANPQKFYVDKPGKYKVELWGGDGSTNSNNNRDGGKGGYAVAIISMTPSDTLYVGTGGAGTRTSSGGTIQGGKNCFNSNGGTATTNGTGGAATEVRLNGTALGNRLLVAGGGGGASNNTIGGNSVTASGTGTPQTGSNAANANAGAGGGGYTGGTSSSNNPGNGGTCYYNNTYVTNGKMTDASTSAGGVVKNPNGSVGCVIVTPVIESVVVSDKLSPNLKFIDSWVKTPTSGTPKKPDNLAADSTNLSWTVSVKAPEVFTIIVRAEILDYEKTYENFAEMFIGDRWYPSNPVYHHTLGKLTVIEKYRKFNQANDLRDAIVTSGVPENKPLDPGFYHVFDPLREEILYGYEVRDMNGNILIPLQAGEFKDPRNLTGNDRITINEDVVIIYYYGDPCPPVLVWLGKSDEWQDPDNWYPSYGILLPRACTDVYIPGVAVIPTQVSYHFPILKNNLPAGKQNICDRIFFLPGGQLGRTDYLTYNEAHVEIDFNGKGSIAPDKSIDYIQFCEKGNPINRSITMQDRVKFAAKYSGVTMERGEWHLLSAPLANITTGDFAFGGFPLSYIKKYAVGGTDNKSYIKGDWEDYNNEAKLEFQPGQGFGHYYFAHITGTPYGMDDNSQWQSAKGAATKLQEPKHIRFETEGINYPFGLAKSNGIVHIPYFANEYLSNARRAHKYTGTAYEVLERMPLPVAPSAKSGTSTFSFYWQSPLTAPYFLQWSDDDNDGQIDTETFARTNSAYRFITEGWDGNFNPAKFESGKTFKTGDIVLVGNPYMSALDYDEFEKANTGKVGKTYEIYAGNSTYYAYNGGFTNPNKGPIKEAVSKYIAPMQSFLIEIPAGYNSSTLTLKFTPAMAEQPNTATKLRAAAQKSYSLLNITASNTHGSTDATLIQYDEAQDGFGDGWDISMKLAKPDELPRVYTIAKVLNSTDKRAAVQNVFKSKDILIPIGVTSTAKVNTELKLTGMDNYDAKIYLVDSQSPTDVDISGMDSYSVNFDFQPANGNEIENRFFLRIVSNPVSIDTNVEAEITVYTSKDDVVVLSPSAIKAVSVYDAQGKLLRREDGKESLSMTVENVLQTKGVYVVYVTTDKEVKSVKVIR